MKRLLPILVIVLVGIGIWFATRPAAAPDTALLLQDARRAASRGDREAALDTIDRLLETDSAHSEALLLAGELATRLDRYDRAIEYYERIPAEIEEYVPALQAIAEIHRVSAHFSAAETYYRRVLAENPKHTIARQRLILIQTMTGRTREAIPEIYRLIEAGTARPDDLIYLADIERPRRADELLDLGSVVAPNDPLPPLGLGVIQLATGTPERSIRLFERSIQLDGELTIARLWLGRALSQTSDWSRLTQWRETLASSAQKLPEYWLVLGRLSLANDQPKEAARCFQNCAALAPNQIEAHFQLGTILIQEGKKADGAAILNWSESLSQLAGFAPSLNSAAPTPEACLRMAQLLLPLKRFREAKRWSELALEQDATLVAAQTILTELPDELGPMASLPKSPAADLDLSEWPLPDFSESQFDRAATPQLSVTDRAIRFDDVTNDVGLDFRYENSDDPTTEGKRMFEFTGGGIAVLDYDRDDWPDLYFTQGGTNFPQETASSSLDQLYRNRAGTRAKNVTSSAGIREAGFSQGCAAGDFDNDGFPDLLVANFGQNRLFRNNGDGTFSDATPAEFANFDQWTTSCALADLNGDGLCDVIEINYVEGNRVKELICETNGTPRVCTPVAFMPTQDQIWLNGGDGAFANITQECGLSSRQGNGLGLVVFDLNGDRRLDLFVANDAVANHLWLNELAAEKNSLQLTESALLSGVAINDSGRAEACMGIAGGDPNRDGLIDLFVTNFHGEANALYLQTSPGLFQHRSEAWNAARPGFDLLGFGTQFLDVDRDGFDDLLIANGDIDDFTDMGRSLRQPSLLLTNNAGHRLEAVEMNEQDSFLNEKILGRSLVRLDWDRNGKEDISVGLLEDRSRLVLNRTDSPESHWIAFDFTGTASARDAIGAVVRVTTSAGTIEKPLLGGDGYQASNQRGLYFAFDGRPSDIAAEIVWPSGATERAESLLLDTRHRLVEGRIQETLKPD